MRAPLPASKGGASRAAASAPPPLPLPPWQAASAAMQAERMKDMERHMALAVR